MENKDKVTENKGRFQSYRFTSEPFIVSIDKSQIPEHVQKRLEELTKKYDVKGTTGPRHQRC
jgi:hypothetical protein